jgi:hypothetical protein
MKLQNQVDWRRVTILIIGLVALSFGLASLLRRLAACFCLPLDESARLAYLSVSGITLASSLIIEMGRELLQNEGVLPLSSLEMLVHCSDCSTCTAECSALRIESKRRWRYRASSCLLMI